MYTKFDSLKNVFKEYNTVPIFTKVKKKNRVTCHVLLAHSWCLSVNKIQSCAVVEDLAKKTCTPIMSFFQTTGFYFCDFFFLSFLPAVIYFNFIHSQLTLQWTSTSAPAAAGRLTSKGSIHL